MKLRWLQHRQWIAPGLVAVVVAIGALTVLGPCSEEGTGEMPSWVLVYPQAQPTVLTTEQKGREQSGALSFTSPDPAKDVLLFYRDQLREAGWDVSSTPFLRPDDVRGGQITAEAPDKKRGLHVMVNALDDGSETILNYSQVP